MCGFSCVALGTSRLLRPQFKQRSVDRYASWWLLCFTIIKRKRIPAATVYRYPTFKSF